jgi:hypothetical protein
MLINHWMSCQSANMLKMKTTKRLRPSNLSASDDEEGEQGGTGGGLQQQVHALDGGRAARVPKLQTRQNGAHEQQQNGAADDRRLLQTAAVTAVQRLQFIVGEPVPVQ